MARRSKFDYTALLAKLVVVVVALPLFNPTVRHGAVSGNPTMLALAALTVLNLGLAIALVITHARARKRNAAPSPANLGGASR